MPVAALVVMLSREPSRREAALAALAGHRGVTLGDAVGDALPVVTDCDDLAAQDALWARIEGAPGVAAVALVRLDFEDVEAFDVPAGRLRRPRRAAEE